MSATSESNSVEKYSNYDLVTFITKHHKITHNKITKLLEGKLDVSDVQDLEEYKELYKIRHDVLHYFIARDRDLPFMERKIKNIPELSKCRDHKYWSLVKEQSPDVIICNGGNIKIIEFTISYSKYAEQSKISKYTTLVHVLKETGFIVDFEIIVYTISISQPDMDDFCRFHNITSDCYQNITKYIETITAFIYRLESTPLGQNWYSQRINLISEPFPQIVTLDSINKYLSSMTNKPISQDQILQDGNSTLTNEDLKFIENCVEIYEDLEEKDIGNYSDSITLKDTVDSLKIKLNSNDTSAHYRPFLPLPYMDTFDDIPQVRNTKDDELLLFELRIELHLTNDKFLYNLGDMKSAIDDVKLPYDVKYQIALEGPGRKKFIKYSLEHQTSQDRNTNYLCPFEAYDHEVEYLLNEFSKYSKGSNIEDITGPGLNYVRACQAIFREININVMRYSKKHKFILKPTSVKGVFVCIWPGPKLRTGENLSTIWFKLIAFKRNIINPIHLNSSFHQWIHTENPEIVQSRWLSTDANRLDHYLRCYDRVRMAFLSYQYQKISPYIEGDELGVIIAIYMEDKRSTSKMIQDTRYLSMISLSIFRHWTEIIKKLDVPLRTPLQSLLLSRMLNYCLSMKDLNSMRGNFKFGKIVNEGGGLISDKYSGANIFMPRILTRGERISFQQLLCEMYFCMLFNKNQDDPTHASFQILDKILEGERKYLDNLQNDPYNLVFGGDDSMECITELFNNKKTHQFSKRAIMIGSKLQSVSKYNRSQSGLAYKLCINSPIINKTLDEFATYKSSSQFIRPKVERDIYNLKKEDTITEPIIEEEFIADIVTERIPVSDKYSQNPRIRCIEGVMNLFNEGLVNSYDVAKKYFDSPLKYQVFKKNQIGGTREILILSIEKRITINILESISRVVCQQDNREMLTHGAQKFSMMKNILRDLRRAPYKSIIIHHNLDKSRWGPTFIPIQFLYIFEPFKNIDINLYNYILITLLVHSQKECILPEKLIRVWMNDIYNKIKHENKDLQQLKTDFLYDTDKKGKLSFKNESNMGQGILHYTSSLLHLCAISFRDEVYKILCRKHKIHQIGEWRDLISSDDSYTAQLVPLDSQSRKRIHLMRKSIRITDLLFNMRTSNSKSSNSAFIGEFNSLFCSNLDTFPTLFKFCLSSVECVNTDSFFRMTKECYQNSRQIVENGGTLDLYLAAQRMNKSFCESLYHTENGLKNDLDHFEIRKEFAPYQIGIYPIDNENPEFMVMFGPEYHNYRILMNESKMTNNERKLFYNCHRLVDKLDPETVAETISYESYHVGFHRIETHMGPIKKLQRIRKKIDYSWEMMKNMIYENPLIILKKPKTIEDVKLRTYLKLFQYGSAEALRTTASSIYYGRMSAAVSAKAYHIPSTEMSVGRSTGRKGYTYFECLSYLVYKDINDMKEIPHEIYPFKEEFETVNRLSTTILELELRDPLETKNLRQLELCKFHTMFQNDLLTLLKTFWEDELSIEEQPSSVKRDWVNLKNVFPMVKDSVGETLMHLNQDDPNKALQGFIVKIMRIMNISARPMKAFIFGQTTRTIDSTYNVLRGQNKFKDYTSKDVTDPALSPESISSVYRIYLLYNIWSILKENKHDVMSVSNLFKYQDLTKLISSKHLTVNIKKRILMMMMDLNLIEDVSIWTAKTGVILHKWIKRQKIVKGKYIGGFTLASQLGNTILMADSIDGKSIELSTNNASSPVVLYELVNETASILNMNIIEFQKLVPIGFFKNIKNKILPLYEENGFDIKTIPRISNLVFSTGNVKFFDNYITLYDEFDQKIMSTGRGYISTDHKLSETELRQIPNVNIYGMKIHDLINLGLFSLEFRFNNLKIRDMINVINDFDVDRPDISYKSAKKLSKYFDLRNFIIYKDNKPIIESILEESDFKDDNALIDDYLDDDFESTEIMDEFVDDINGYDLDKKEEINLINNMLDLDLDELNLVTDLQPIKAKLSSIVLHDRIKYCKYNIICRLFYSPNELSSASIKYMYDYSNYIGIVYSMVFVYDRIYYESDLDSPPILKPKIPKAIIEKFPNVLKELEISQL